MAVDPTSVSHDHRLVYALFFGVQKDRGESMQRVFAINSKSAWLRLAGLFVPIALIGSCAIGPRVTRTSSDEAIDVSG